MATRKTVMKKSMEKAAIPRASTAEHTLSATPSAQDLIPKPSALMCVPSTPANRASHIKPHSKSDKKLFKRLMDEVVESFIRFGHIDPDDKSKKQIEQEIRDWFASNKVKNQPRFAIIIDHTDSLISSARQFKKNKNMELSVVTYALFF